MNFTHPITEDPKFNQLVEETKLRLRRNAVVECDALIAAGWKFELPEIVNNWPTHESEPWQWYWRSPPRRRGSKGRKYWSTTQAFNALRRQQSATATQEGRSEE